MLVSGLPSHMVDVLPYTKLYKIYFELPHRLRTITTTTILNYQKLSTQLVEMTFQEAYTRAMAMDGLICLTSMYILQAIITPKTMTMQCLVAQPRYLMALLVTP